MNSYYLNISVPWIIAILSLIVTAFISYFYYRNTSHQLNPSQRLLLRILRTVALSILLFIIFEPVFTHIAAKIEKPKIALLIDNSISAGLNDGKIDRKKVIKTVLDKNPFLLADNQTMILFGNDVSLKDKLSFDSLKFNGQMTNLSLPFEFIRGFEQNSNVKAIVLISDGSSNTGGNPLYAAEKSGVPVYSIGIGDTSTQKDVIVRSLFTNETVAINSLVPVNINIRVQGFSTGNVKVGLYDNNEKISEQIIKVNPEIKDYNLVFEYMANKSGTRKLTARADNIPEEISVKNNSVSEFINVTAQKKKILILAGAPSPDLSFISKALNINNTVEIKKFVQKYKSEFYDHTPGATDFNSADAYFLIGFPNFSSPVSVLQLLKNGLDKGKPLFFIASQDLDYSKLKLIDAYLPFSVLSSNNREYSATAQFTEKSKANVLTRITGNDEELKQWNDQAPIYRTETFVKVKPEAEVIANVKINTTVLHEPLILSRQFSNQKSVAILGYGLYRWKLAGYAQDKFRKNTDKQDLFSKFIENSNQWLNTEADKKNIVIKPVRRTFQNNEKVEFFAQVNDAAMNPVDNADLKISVTGGKTGFEFNLSSKGNGLYSGYAENVEQGEYYYLGIATKNGTILGEDKGRFDVGDLPVEFQDIKMNIHLLKQLADRSGGIFYFNDNVEKLENDIKSNKTFTSDDIVVRSETALWNEPLLLALAIVLFAIEWFLRKRFGLL